MKACSCGLAAILSGVLSLPFATATDDLKFSPQPVWTSGSSYGGGDGNARWLDYDRDGDPDLVTSAPDPRRWVIFANSDGQLEKTPVWESQPTTDCDHISVLDFNQDGWPDLAATHESHCTLYLNKAGQTTLPFTTTPDWETGLYTDANQIDFGDPDGDGDLDMLMASGLPVYSLAVFQNQNGQLAHTVTDTFGPRDYSESAIFCDHDNDGVLDVIATYPRAGTVIAFQYQNGKFDQGSLIYKDERVRHVQRVYCVDLDQNGAPELFCAKGPWGPPGASVGLGRQAAGQAYDVIWRSAENTGYHGFDFADVDQDGDLDLAAADWAGRRVAIYLQQDGQLATTAAWSAPTGSPAHEVHFADVDGDSDPDLAVGCLSQAQVFQNQANSPNSR